MDVLSITPNTMMLDAGRE